VTYERSMVTLSTQMKRRQVFCGRHRVSPKATRRTSLGPESITVWWRRRQRAERTSSKGDIELFLPVQGRLGMASCSNGRPRRTRRAS